MLKRSEPNRKANIWIARAVPVILLAITGYVSWVVTKLLCVDYLINPTPSTFPRSRPGSAIAITVIHYVLLIYFLVVYGRLLDTITRHPGIIPRGPQFYLERQRLQNEKKEALSKNHDGGEYHDKALETDFSKYDTPKEIDTIASDNLDFKVEDFWKRDVFVCNYDGRPRYCTTCFNWKPDRAHHCSELNRCVLKMDHFCPWVGGLVAEPSFKFFIQFTFFGALLCTHVLVVVAYYFAERKRNTGFLNANWIAALSITALFWLFSAGMCMSSLQLAFVNLTTIENLNRKSVVWYLAVYISPVALEEVRQREIPLRTISYPRPIEEQIHILRQAGSDVSNAATTSLGGQGGNESGIKDFRTFAILETKPGANPWNRGLLQNFQDVMGITIWEWLLPIRASPLSRHDDLTSLYKLGSLVDQEKQNINVVSWQNQNLSVGHGHRRTRRHSTGQHHKRSRKLRTARQST